MSGPPVDPDPVCKLFLSPGKEITSAWLGVGGDYIVPVKRMDPQNLVISRGERVQGPGGWLRSRRF